MSSSEKVLRRMDNRIAKISEDIDYYIEYFNKSENFVGPSIYFHHKTLQHKNQHTNLESLLNDDLFFDYLYATLTSWGLHRMGPGNTKLVDIDTMKKSIKAAASKLSTLWELSIYDLTENDATRIADFLWNLFSKLKISIAEAKIVSCSKALHHILPLLIPPIDRSYTFYFFYGRTSLSISEEEALSEIFRRMHKIAVANKQKIDSWVGNGFNTSITKVIDNAIVGYVLDEL
jgi:hypothetical protein